MVSLVLVWWFAFSGVVLFCGFVWRVSLGRLRVGFWLVRVAWLGLGCYICWFGVLGCAGYDLSCWVLIC